MKWQRFTVSFELNLHFIRTFQRTKDLLRYWGSALWISVWDELYSISIEPKYSIINLSRTGNCEWWTTKIWKWNSPFLFNSSRVGWKKQTKEGNHHSIFVSSDNLRLMNDERRMYAYFYSNWRKSFKAHPNENSHFRGNSRYECVSFDFLFPSGNSFGIADAFSSNSIMNECFVVPSVKIHCNKISNLFCWKLSLNQNVGEHESNKNTIILMKTIMNLGYLSFVQCKLHKNFYFKLKLHFIFHNEIYFDYKILSAESFCEIKLLYFPFDQNTKSR